MGRRDRRPDGIDWAALADRRPHCLVRGRDFDEPLDALVDLARHSAEHLGMVSLAVRDVVGTREQVWVQFADATVQLGRPCVCGAPDPARLTQLLARCATCDRLLLTRTVRERASTEALALVARTLAPTTGAPPVEEPAGAPVRAQPARATARELIRTEAQEQARAEIRERLRVEAAERALAEKRARGEQKHAIRTEAQALREEQRREAEARRAERETQREQRAAWLEVRARHRRYRDDHGHRLEDFTDVELFPADDERVTFDGEGIERFVGYGTRADGSAVIMQVVYFLVDGERVPDPRFASGETYWLIALSLDTIASVARLPRDEE